MFKLKFIHKTLDNKEVINFLDKHHKIFNSVEIKLLPTKIHAHNRSLMSQIEHIYEKENREDILKYILSFYDKEKLIIEKNDGLKSFLYGLNERIYQTPVTNEKKVANSVIEFKLNSIKLN